jgi:hypothetical protein
MTDSFLPDAADFRTGALKKFTDAIAREAFAVWQQGGDYEAIIDRRCAESNITDWKSTVKDSLTRIINEAHLDSRIYQA